MRAQVDDRQGAVVEGLLRLNYVPSLDYVQVDVEMPDGSASVRPQTVEVVQPGTVPGPRLAPAGSRAEGCNYDDLDEAIKAGLVTPTRIREGGTWEDMFARLDAVVAPLLAAGWVVFDTNQKENWEHGDSISYDLRRGVEEIEIEQYEFGRVVVYPLADDPNTDDGFTEPLFALNDPSPDECPSAFQDRGWLS